jgi:glucose-1-phosphate thymidylyltransferase
MIGKGIILAGGAGTRLYPLSRVVCKQLLPVYDKPMIYYPLATLMQSGIRDILLISTPKDLPCFQEIFGDGSQLGLSIHYVKQERPEGIAHAFILAADFINSDPVALVLGDNLFHGRAEAFRNARSLTSGALIFGYLVGEPRHYGVLEFDAKGRVSGIEEKPDRPKSSYAVPGFYAYDARVVEFSRAVKPSSRGELEITDVNLAYLRRGELRVELLGRDMTWLDTGSPESLAKASHYIATIEDRQGVKIGCLEELAFELGYIGLEQLEGLIAKMPASPYRSYVERVASRAT